MALVAMVAFLDRNGWELTATSADALRAILGAAAGTVTERGLAQWIERHLGRVGQE